MSSNGTSLRRSCQGCVKVKRRCDLLFPECSRCLKKGVRCQYINIPLSNRTSPPGDNNGGRITKPMPSRQQVYQQQQQNHLYNAVVAAVTTNTKQRGDFDVLALSRPKLLTTSSDEGSDEGSNSDDSNHTTNNDDIIPSDGGTWIRPAMDMEIRKHHSPYIVDLVARTVRQAPRRFIEGRSIFIHPCVYGRTLPRPVQDMRALCALYENQSDEYRPSSVRVSNLVQRQIVSLIQSARKTTSFEDLVAHVQALTLAQCIQLSEGNIKGPAVEKSLDILAALARKMWYMVPRELPNSMSPWHAWIFAETVRRTIVFSHLVIAAFSFVTRGYAYRTPFIDALPFDGRTFLWDVSSEDEWSRINAKSDFPMVSVIEFTDLLQSGRALCFSSFEGMIIATCRGIELPIHDPSKLVKM